MRLDVLVLAVLANTAPAGEPLREALLVTDPREGLFEVYDSQSGEKIARVKSARTAQSLVVDGERAYAGVDTAEGPAGALAVLNLRSLAADRIDLGDHRRPSALASDGNGRLWLACDGDESLLLLDPAGRGVVASVPMGSARVRDLVVTPDGAKVYAAHEDAAYLTAVDAKEPRSARRVTLPAPSGSLALSPDGRILYAADKAKPLVYVLDTARDEVLKSVPLAAVARRIGVSADGRHVVVTSDAPKTIEVLDASTLVSRGQIRTGDLPARLAFHPSKPIVYVAGARNATLAVVNLERLKVVKRFNAGTGAGGLAFAWLPRR
jgi:DNA-binding beta-propeller fold protein YncE